MVGIKVGGATDAVYLRLAPFSFLGMGVRSGAPAGTLREDRGLLRVVDLVLSRSRPGAGEPAIELRKHCSGRLENGARAEQ